MRGIKPIGLSLAFVLLPVLLTGCPSSKTGVVKSHLDEGEYKKALREANKGLKDNPDDKMLVYHRGQAKKGLGRYEAAIEDFRKALKLNEDNEWAKWPAYRMGQINMDRGHYQEAVDNFTSALRFEQNWIKALQARAEAKSQMGNEVEAEEDRQLIRKIKERRAKKRRRKNIRKERKKLMKAWNNLTNGAPLKNYGFEIGGLPREKVWDVWPVFRSSSSSCDMDSGRTSFEEVDGTLTELGGEAVKRENLEDHYYQITWRYTWWFESHPDIKFDYFLAYRFENCGQEKGGADVLMVSPGQGEPVKEWGHEPKRYDPHIEYEENEKQFRASRFPKWTEEWHAD